MITDLLDDILVNCRIEDPNGDKRFTDKQKTNLYFSWWKLDNIKFTRTVKKIQNWTTAMIEDPKINMKAK